jgi:hypothetical protein
MRDEHCKRYYGIDHAELRRREAEALRKMLITQHKEWRAKQGLDAPTQITPEDVLAIGRVMAR